MCMDSQGENSICNSIHNLPHIADFRLKCCILKEDTKNNISGSNKQNLSSFIFQAEPMPRINEFTYKSSATPRPKDQPLLDEMCKKAGPFLPLPLRFIEVGLRGEKRPTSISSTFFLNLSIYYPGRGAL